MPYHSNAELPDSVEDHLPKHAQDIYREAFKSAREETAHKVAWATVKHKCEKRGDDWHPMEGWGQTDLPTTR